MVPSVRSVASNGGVDGARALTTSEAPERRSEEPSTSSWDTLTTGLALGLGLVFFGFILGVFVGSRARRAIEEERARSGAALAAMFGRNVGGARGTGRTGENNLPRGVNRFGEIE